MRKNCIYILESNKDGRFYIGQTDNITERMSAHNRGSVNSTKNRRSLNLVYFETFDNRSEAVKKESNIKGSKNALKYLQGVALSSKG